ncbi:hypothetical protein N8T08_001157 [Aspergillus melleus]|uniref:Uncharacterized protein n=1 Tax=Aspergillus melleus TaxID=138277 RepID=A0ACC3ANR0_9EURO|nr:hypothetical protein N8T08_001157 [Aspergillus melleus]
MGLCFSFLRRRMNSGQVAAGNNITPVWGAWEAWAGWEADNIIVVWEWGWVDRQEEGSVDITAVEEEEGSVVIMEAMEEALDDQGAAGLVDLLEGEEEEVSGGIMEAAVVVDLEVRGEDDGDIEEWICGLQGALFERFVFLEQRSRRGFSRLFYF